tara:strand:- start:127 stop:1659 length:1533 start_codon:yes stop_codon:yes gene_type:complete
VVYLDPKDKKYCGVLLHPTSLPSKEICGTLGQSCLRFLESLNSNGIKIWQFLPLSPPDSIGSPYSSPSSFALNPWLIDSSSLIDQGYISVDFNSDSFLKDHNSSTGRFDFEKADLRASKVSKMLIDNWSKQSKERHSSFNLWFKNNLWIEDHACFYELKKQNDLKPWWEWPKEYSIRDKNTISNWKKNNRNILLSYALMQWHLDKQWKLIKNYAEKLNIILFGDVPFYVAKDSADVWGNQNLFAINSDGNSLHQSGVPPDYFSETGQLWGNPTYYWNKHKRTKFIWWRNRFKRQWELFHLLRLDHFRALSGYWCINGKDQTAKNGRWKPSPGLHLLNFLKKDFRLNKLPLVAEDLGVITSDVDRLRNYFNLYGMKILQFAFDGNPDNPYLPKNITERDFIAYTGTHDNQTTESWWKESNDEIKRQVLSISDINIQSPSMRFIDLGMSTQASIFIAPIQDILGLDDKARFNKPGTTKGNWDWKLQIKNDELNQSLKNYGDLATKHNRNMNK